MRGTCLSVSEVHLCGSEGNFFFFFLLSVKIWDSGKKSAAIYIEKCYNLSYVCSDTFDRNLNTILITSEKWRKKSLSRTCNRMN